MNLSFFEKWIWNNIQTIELKLRYMSKNTELSLSFDVSIFQDIQARDWIPVSRMRDELSSNWATTAVLHIVKGDQPERSSGRDCITEVPCYNKRRTIKKIPTCSKAEGAEYRLKFCCPSLSIVTYT